MRWLVDGMNVIGSRPDGWWRDREAAKRKLAAELSAYAAATGDPVTVVFDGSPFEIDEAEARVLFAPGGRDAADDRIVELLEDEPDVSGLVVVTSDAELARRARAQGAEVVGARSLRRRLGEAAREHDA